MPNVTRWVFTQDRSPLAGKPSAGYVINEREHLAGANHPPGETDLWRADFVKSSIFVNKRWGHARGIKRQAGKRDIRDWNSFICVPPRYHDYISITNKQVINNPASVLLFTAETFVYSQVITMENLTASLLNLCFSILTLLEYVSKSCCFHEFQMHQICLGHVVRTPQHPKLNPADSGLEFRLNRETPVCMCGDF